MLIADDRFVYDAVLAEPGVALRQLRLVLQPEPDDCARSSDASTEPASDRLGISSGPQYARQEAWLELAEEGLLRLRKPRSRGTSARYCPGMCPTSPGSASPRSGAAARRVLSLYAGSAGRLFAGNDRVSLGQPGPHAATGFSLPVSRAFAPFRRHTSTVCARCGDGLVLRRWGW